ncbi:transcription elongation factor spt5 [Terramyces sp. JEL0728]|nr:transcription elongation factor spt5 [Terramyces sp. JEL0728]
MSDESDIELFSDGEEKVLEQDSEQEEDEDEVENLRERKRQKKKRAPGSMFIEAEAHVDDDDDDDDEDEAEDGFEYVDEGQEKVSSRDKARFRELDQARVSREEINPEDLAERLNERYRRVHGRSGFRGDVDRIPQSLLIPSVQDPKLWLVRCKPGSEKNIVSNLCRKSFEMENTGTPMGILSCFTRDSLPGYLYLEATRQAHVMQAITNMNNVYASKLQLVPVNEMVDCLRIKPKDLDIKIGMWVRMKRGKYGGDLAQVLDIADSGDSATLKLIPRLDYSKDGGKRKKGASDVRHPQKLFSPHDFKKREISATAQGYQYQGEFFDRVGYLEKQVKISSIETKNINPSLEEITKFSGGAVADRGEDLSLLASSNVAKGDDFQSGEKVIVLSGEMKNVPAIVHSVQNGIVTIIPDKSYGLANYVKYPARDLAKRFTDGDHVKVISGVHKDATGLILKVEENIATVLSDSTFQPIDVFTKDLRSVHEVTSIVPATSQFEAYDLVRLSPNEVGVVIKMDKDVITLLDPNGRITKVKPQQIRSKMDSSRAVTSDLNSRPVKAGDSVIVIDETSSNRKQASVLHIFRSYVFLKSRDVLENGGVFVSRSSSVALINAANGNANSFAAPPIRSGMGRGRGRDELKGKTVIVTGGTFKGYLGIVKDTTENHARVELHTGSRTIEVEKAKLLVQGEDGANRRPDYRSRYDAVKTPMHGSKTPMHNAGGDSWNTGSRTPAWNAGSKTPAWDSGSKTPAWDAGAKTPAWDSSSRTPARDFGKDRYSDSNTAPTPAYVDSSTPYHSTTPAAFPATPAANVPTSVNYTGVTAATPRGQYDVATPMVNPATPMPAGGMDYNDDEDDGANANSWLTTDIDIQIISKAGRKFSGGAHDSRIGKCTAVHGGRATIALDSGDTVTVPEEFLAPVVPQKKENFKILSGENKGRIGLLLSIDGQEGVVRIDGGDEILMENMDNLARLSI